MNKNRNNTASPKLSPAPTVKGARAQDHASNLQHRATVKKLTAQQNADRRKERNEAPWLADAQQCTGLSGVTATGFQERAQRLLGTILPGVKAEVIHPPDAAKGVYVVKMLLVPRSAIQSCQKKLLHGRTNFGTSFLDQGRNFHMVVKLQYAIKPDGGNNANQAKAVRSFFRDCFAEADVQKYLADPRQKQVCGVSSTYNITPRLYFAGISKDDRCCFVTGMQLVEGTPLKLSATLTPEMYVNVEKAVVSLWLKGVAHGDLHGKNILVKAKDVKIIDFGFSKKIPDAASQGVATKFSRMVQSGSSAHIMAIWDAHLKDNVETHLKYGRGYKWYNSDAKLLGLAYKRVPKAQRGRIGELRRQAWKCSSSSSSGGVTRPPLQPRQQRQQQPMANLYRELFNGLNGLPAAAPSPRSSPTAGRRSPHIPTMPNNRAGALNLSPTAAASPRSSPAAGRRGGGNSASRRRSPPIPTMPNNTGTQQNNAASNLASELRFWESAEGQAVQRYWESAEGQAALRYTLPLPPPPPLNTNPPTMPQLNQNRRLQNATAATQADLGDTNLSGVNFLSFMASDNNTPEKYMKRLQHLGLEDDTPVKDTVFTAAAKKAAVAPYVRDGQQSCLREGQRVKPGWFLHKYEYRKVADNDQTARVRHEKLTKVIDALQQFKGRQDEGEPKALIWAAKWVALHLHHKATLLSSRPKARLSSQTLRADAQWIAKRYGYKGTKGAKTTRVKPRVPRLPARPPPAPAPPPGPLRGLRALLRSSYPQIS